MDDPIPTNRDNLFGDFRITVGESDVIPERIPFRNLGGFVCLVKGQQVVFRDPNVSMSTSTAARVKMLIAVHAPGFGRFFDFTETQKHISVIQKAA